MGSGELSRLTSSRKRIRRTICPCCSSTGTRGWSSASSCRRVDCDALGSKLNQAIEVRLQIRFKLCKELDDGERVLVERWAVGGDRSIASEEPSRGAPGR